MVHFVVPARRAGSDHAAGAAALLQRADVVIYAGSLVNPALLENTRPGVEIYNSAEMTLEEVLAQMQAAERRTGYCAPAHGGSQPVRCGARADGCAGCARHSLGRHARRFLLCGAAAALGAEYTLPGVSQTLIVTRLAGRTGVPEREALPALAAHGASMALFLSAGNLRACNRRCWKGRTTRIPPLPSCTKPPGPTSAWCAARWVRWLPPVQRRASQNGAAAGGGISGRRICAQQALRPGVYHGVSRGAGAVKIALLSFSAQGQALAGYLAEKLGGTAQRCGRAVSLSGWTESLYRVRRAGVCGGGRHCRTSHCALLCRIKHRSRCGGGGRGGALCCAAALGPPGRSERPGPRIGRVMRSGERHHHGH